MIYENAFRLNGRGLLEEIYPKQKEIWKYNRQLCIDGMAEVLDCSQEHLEQVFLTGYENIYLRVFETPKIESTPIVVIVGYDALENEFCCAFVANYDAWLSNHVDGCLADDGCCYCLPDWRRLIYKDFKRNFESWNIADRFLPRYVKKGITVFYMWRLNMLKYSVHLMSLVNQVFDLQSELLLINESEIEPYILSLGELANTLYTLADKRHDKLSTGVRVYDTRNNSTGVIYKICADKALVGWDPKEQFVDCAANKCVGRAAGTACWTKLEHLELI